MLNSFDVQYIKSLLGDGSAVEVLEWLGRGPSSHYVGEMSFEESLELVKELYALGAKSVLAVKIGENAGLASTDHLVVELPENRYQRDDIFRWNNNRVARMGVDPDIDHGQSCLLIYFD